MTFKEFEEICEQIHKEEEIQCNDEKEKIDSNIYLLRKGQLRNMYLVYCIIFNIFCHRYLIIF